MARYNSAPKVRVNAGGMTQYSKAWEYHNSPKMVQFFAMHIRDIENNPATSVLTGGWNGTASTFITELRKLPELKDVPVPAFADLTPVMDAIAGEPTQGELAIQKRSDEIAHQEQINNAEIAAMESDPWADDIANPHYEMAQSTIADPTQLVGPGVYVYDCEFYSVKESTQNPGRHYAHKIKLVGNKFKHVYAPGIIFKLTEEMRANADVIVAMNRDTIHTNAKGQRVGSCCVCGRMLTKASSIDAGIGPVCGGRVGL
jgi:hypothetical protein